ncbi:hypothetical protein CBS101457_000976 [Exobasidium rhododendri]|nr:hypothetical protein CBS101457_000976 [Exobasidium rhododendri]
MTSSSSARSTVPMQSDDSSSSIPSRHLSNHLPSSYRASPSPSATSQSDDQDRDEEDDDLEEEEEDDYTDVGSSNFQLKERRNTLKAKGSAALPVLATAPNSSETWQLTPANARNASAGTLPHEILLHIFKYVAVHPPHLRRSLTVCKSWCLCGVELLWHRPSFLRISSLFKMIHIIRRPDQTFPYATFIRRLNLSMLSSDLEDSLFGRLAVCTRLERLTLTGCTMISDETITDVLSQIKHLVAVDFSDVSQLTDKSILTIAHNCPRLQGINITGCKRITSNSVATLAQNCKLLRRVKLCGCELVGDSALTSLAQHCPVLLEVDLINCPMITDASVREMWRHSFHMRELRLAQCGKLTDLAFPAPNSSISGVSASNIVGVGGGLSSIEASAQQYSNFYGGSESAPASRGASPLGIAPDQTTSSIMTSQNNYLTSNDAFPRTLSIPSQTPMYGHLRTIRMFDHLRILDLTNCNTISDAAIDGIVSNVPRIRNLILAKCTRLTNESAYSIARLGKNLHYLHLGHVSNLTDRGICHLAQSCTRLRYIDLACCPQLTDLSVLELASNLPKLRRIGLVRVTNLTDNAIYGLVGRYTSLERIHLSYCEHVSVPAVFWLLERLSRLTHLSLTGVPAFRKPELQAMCREPPREFNAHQRTAFCVYSGKGVNELRKFLQNAYSGDDPSWELSDDLQRARTYLARANRADVRSFMNHHHPDHAPPPSTDRTFEVQQPQPIRTIHHLATRSDPQHSNRLLVSGQGRITPNQPQQIVRLSPIGTLHEPTSGVSSSSSSSSFRQIVPPTLAYPESRHRTTTLERSSRADNDEWEAMEEDGRDAPTSREQREEDEGGGDDDDDDDEVGESDLAHRTPTALAPSANFSFQGPSIRGSEGLASKSTTEAPPSSFAFAGAGRSLGGSSQRVSQSQRGPSFGNMAALATPPLSSTNSFFPSVIMTHNERQSAEEASNDSFYLTQSEHPLPHLSSRSSYSHQQNGGASSTTPPHSSPP